MCGLFTDFGKNVKRVTTLEHSVSPIPGAFFFSGFVFLLLKYRGVSVGGILDGSYVDDSW